MLVHFEVALKSSVETAWRQIYCDNIFLHCLAEMACDPTQHADLGAVLLHEGMESKIPLWYLRTTNYRKMLLRILQLLKEGLCTFMVVYGKICCFIHAGYSIHARTDQITHWLEVTKIVRSPHFHRIKKKSITLWLCANNQYHIHAKTKSN